MVAGLLKEVRSVDPRDGVRSRLSDARCGTAPTTQELVSLLFFRCTQAQAFLLKLAEALGIGQRAFGVCWSCEPEHRTGGRQGLERDASRADRCRFVVIGDVGREALCRKHTHTL